jgi:hypothetical protein
VKKMRVNGLLQVAITVLVLLIVAGCAFGQNCPVQFPGQQLVPTVTLQPESSGTYPAGTSFSGFVSQTGDPCAPWSGQSVHFLGWEAGGSSEELPGTGSRLVYRYKLDYGQQVSISSVVIQGAAFQGTDCCPQVNGPAEIRLLDTNKNVLSTLQTNSGNSFQTYTMPTPGSTGQVFYLDEFTTSATWRYRSSIVVNTGCQVNTCRPGVTDTCVSLTVGQKPGWPPRTSMDAVLLPPPGMTSAEYAQACAFTEFNWKQTVEFIPPPSPFQEVGLPPAFIPIPLSAGSGITFLDPPPGGYAVPNDPSLANPFYYDATELALNPVVCALDQAEGVGSVPVGALCFHDAPADACLQGGDKALQAQYCGGNAAAAGAALLFKTALVGVSGSFPSGMVLNNWEWQDNFNGTADGFILVLSNPGVVDPGSGTGGISITSVNGVQQTPPTVSCTATPNTLWPPNGNQVPVTVSGVITPGTSSLVSGGTSYTVIDEYGQDQPSGPITLGSGGSYLFQVPLIAARNGNDHDGRTYTIVVNGQDTLGNMGSCSAVVTVPHDRGH